MERNNWASQNSQRVLELKKKKNEIEDLGRPSGRWEDNIEISIK
jgi:hypothetical protein